MSGSGHSDFSDRSLDDELDVRTESSATSERGRGGSEFKTAKMVAAASLLRTGERPVSIV